MNWKAIVNQIRNYWQLSFGYKVAPKISVAATANTPDAGCCFYCIKPLSGNATIDTIKDMSDAEITALGGAVIQQGDEFKFRCSEVTFTTTDPVVLYQKLITEEEGQ